MKINKKTSGMFEVKVSTLSLSQGVIVFDIYDGNKYCGQCFIKGDTGRTFIFIKSQYNKDDKEKINKKINDVLNELIENDVI